MSISLSALSNYTYSYGSTVKPNLDKNDDGGWSLTELSNYTDAYKKATGTELDAQAMLADYDKDGDGILSSSEQQSLLNDDALGFGALSGTQSGTADSSDASSYMASLMAGMSGSGKYSLLNMSMTAEQNSFLISSLSSSYDFSSVMSDLINRQSSLNLYRIQSLYADTSSSGADTTLDLYT